MKKAILACILLLLVSSICFAAADPNQGLKPKPAPSTSTEIDSSPTKVILDSAPTTTPNINYKATPKVALIISGDDMVQTHATSQKYIKEQLTKKFPESQFKLIDDNKIKQEILILQEEANNQNIRLLLDKNHLVDLGKRFDADYVVFLYYILGSTNYHDGVWSSSYEVSVTLESKIINVKENRYIFRQDIVANGKTSNAMGIPAFTTAIFRGVTKSTDQFNQLFDSSTMLN